MKTEDACQLSAGNSAGSGGRETGLCTFASLGLTKEACFPFDNEDHISPVAGCSGVWTPVKTSCKPIV